MGRHANKAPRKSARKQEAGGHKVKNGQSAADASRIIPVGQRADKLGGLDERGEVVAKLTRAIRSNQLLGLDAYSNALKRLGGDVFEEVWWVVENNGRQKTALDVFDLAQRVGANDCLVWLMRAGLNAGNARAKSLFSLLRAEIENKNQAPAEWNTYVALFKKLFRPLVLRDAREMMAVQDLEQKLGPQCLRIWGDMLTEFLATHEQISLANDPLTGTGPGQCDDRQSQRL